MPGTIIRERTQRVPRTLPTDTGVLFMAGIAERGRNDQSHFVSSIAEFERLIGKRVSYSIAWDMAEAFFNEGGSKMYFSRVFGPAPVTAFVNLPDNVAAVSLIARASSPGDWGNALNVQVLAGDQAGEFKIQITHDTDTTINQTSPSLVDQAAAIAWASTNDYIRLELGASVLDPVAGAVLSLATGTDDRANATDETWLAALDRFGKELGPGQVIYAGRTTTTAHTQLLAHAANNNRVALCDTTDVSVVGTLTVAAAAFRALANVKFGGLFHPWVNLPALTTGGSTRAIPPSAVVAGVIARNDGAGLTPNDPAAGDRGWLNYPVSLRSLFSDIDAETLNSAALNLIRQKSGEFKIYGFRTGADKTANPLHWQLGNARLYMAIAAKADAILERFVFRKIDGRKLVFKELDGLLSTMLDDYWRANALYGATPAEAFYVDTDSVNTALTIADGQIKAAIEITMSPMGETVTLDIVRRAITA